VLTEETLMTPTARAVTWLRIAVVYFVVAVTLGIVMGASGDHSLMPVHAHINMLGWVCMTLFGLIGHVYPATTQGRMADIQFWLYNLTVPVLLVTLTLVLSGNPALEPVLGALSVVTGVAVLLFALGVWNSVKVTATAAR
jgi:hypothetical protein